MKPIFRGLGTSTKKPLIFANSDKIINAKISKHRKYSDALVIYLIPKKLFKLGLI